MPRRAKGGGALVLKRHMEPVKKMLSEECTTAWKEIVLIGMRGKRVICKTSMFIHDQGREVITDSY